MSTSREQLHADAHDLPFTYNIHRERVAGNSGMRFAWLGCPYGCWHNSKAQAERCAARHEAAKAKRLAASVAS